MTDLQKIIDRAINDPAYGEKLKKDPAGALADVEVKSSPEKISALHAALDALLKARSVFHGGHPTD